MSYENLSSKEILEEISRVRIEKKIPLDEKRAKLSEYELNELTPIPEDWLYVTSNEISEFITNGVHSPTSSKDELGLGIKMLRITDINDGSIASFEDLPYCKRFKGTDYGKFIQKNDIYISFTGNKLGKRYFVKESMDDVVFAHYFVRIRPLVCDPRYIYYVIQSFHFDHFMYRRTLGSSQPNLKVIDLKRIPLPICSLSEQKAIADILSSLDENIELNNKINKNLEEMAKALYKQWFVDFEFPNEEGEPYKSSGGEMIESELGLIPKGWEVKKIKNVMNFIKKSSKAGKHLADRVYTPIDMLPKKQLIIEDYKTYGEAKSSLLLYEKNDILIGAMRVYFHRVNLAPFSGITRTTTFVIRGIQEDDLSHNLLLLNLDSTIEYANGTSRGSTMPYAVWDNGLGEMEIAYSDSDIRKRFNDIVYPTLNQMINNTEQNRFLSKTRDTLLPKLMSGEIRVPIKE